jgi:hypothetical protein
LIHVDYFPLGNPQALGKQFGLGIEPFINQFLLFFFQLEKKLSLPLGGTDLYQPPVVHDEL